MSRNLTLLLIVVFILIGAVILSGQDRIDEPTSTPTSTPQATLTVDNSDESDTINDMDQELLIEDLEVGTGEEVVEGSEVEVHYTGTLTDGTKFDSSLNRNQTFKFTVGEGRVIEGWEQGLLGMKVGGKRKLTIPPHLAYGEAGAGDIIGPNETLVFEIDLVSVN